MAAEYENDFADDQNDQSEHITAELPSPCATCFRVKNPAACENKNCKVWREWFSAAWDRARLQPVLQRQLHSHGISTVNIGGTHYAMPHQVKEYLQDDPCKHCPFPKELCNSPCPAKRSWSEITKEVPL